MFKTISRLIFGGEEEAPEDVRTKESVEEGWHVVTHQETHSAANQDVPVTDTQPSNSSVCGNTAANMEADGLSDAEATAHTTPTTTSSTVSSPSRAVSAALSQPKAPAEVSQLTCIQKAKVWADRHYVSRNAVQRQNRVRHEVQPHHFQLQQPGHRSLCH